MANPPKDAPRLDGLITQPQPESHPRWQTVGRMKSAPIFYAGRCPRHMLRTIDLLRALIEVEEIKP